MVVAASTMRWLHFPVGLTLMYMAIVYTVLGTFKMMYDSYPSKHYLQNSQNDVLHSSFKSVFFSILFLKMKFDNLFCMF